MSRRRLLIVLGAGLGVLVIALAAELPLTSGRVRSAVVAELSRRLNGAVELGSLNVGLLPTPHATGTLLVVRDAGRQDVPPLISVKAFTVRAGVIGLLRHRISHVSLEGLDIRIPPTREVTASVRAAVGGSWEIDDLVSTNARLAILPATPRHEPKVWMIHDLRMRSVGDRSMPFKATLTNAVPPGLIAVAGHFGPWNTGDPGGTPLDGQFTFDHADLSVFRGISGMLSSHGTFGGTLARVSVDGEAETPTFRVDVAGHPVPLHVSYHAVVDGTNGNTTLDPVNASFFKTTIVARGAVVNSNPGQPGREVRLNVAIQTGRIEDLLLLAVKSSRPLSGALTLDAALVLPPGDDDVARKLRLGGTFALSDARFTSPDVSRSIGKLSRRSQGDLDDAGKTAVTSDFTGRFHLAGGQLVIPAVTFTVPGAVVRLHGTYSLEQETIDFHGTLLTDVRVSEMTSGVKSFLLKLLDPLFNRKGGGAQIPIHVTGTKSDPSFGLDKGRVFKR